MSMVQRDPSVPGYDWSARVRTTALEALRYSRFVHLMKRVLSLGAFLIIAAVLAFFFAQRLFDNGVFATPAIYPAVRRGQAIIRTSYMATHTPQQLEYVLETFERIARELHIFEDDVYQRAAGEISQRHRDTSLPQPVRTAAV